MSDQVKPKWTATKARAVADELLSKLQPFCERIVIAGSLRRGKPMVSDIELLFIPKTTTRPDGLFDTVPVDLCAEACDAMVKAGYLAQRKSSAGHTAWGEKNKLAVHVESGIPVDLFATTEENWFVALVIRTGSKETNLRLTTGANNQRASLMAYGCGVKYSDETVVRATSEEHVFQLCRVPYLPPEKR